MKERGSSQFFRYFFLSTCVIFEFSSCLTGLASCASIFVIEHRLCSTRQERFFLMTMLLLAFGIAMSVRFSARPCYIFDSSLSALL